MADTTREHVDAPVRVALVLATSTGGVGRHVAALARGLVERGLRVVVLGPAATDRAFAFSSIAAPRSAVCFGAVEIASGVRPLAAVRAAARLRRVLRGADIVHAHGLRAAAVCQIAVGLMRSVRSRARRPAFIVTFHNAMQGGRIRRRLLTFAMQWVARAADLVLVVSADLASDLDRAGVSVERALVASALAAPTQDGGSVRAALGVSGGGRLVLAVGRLHAQKGYDTLVEAARLLPADPPVVVAIAGEGPQRAELTQLIGASGVDVRLLGDRRDVSELVHAADVVVMPSRWEGWPLAAAEVLGAGRPLVATRVGGLPDLVADAAMLVEPGDPRALAAALSQVLSNPELAARLAANALGRAAKLPTSDTVTDHVLACYDRVLAPRR